MPHDSRRAIFDRNRSVGPWSQLARCFPRYAKMTELWDFRPFTTSDRPGQHGLSERLLSTPDSSPMGSEPCAPFDVVTRSSRGSVAPFTMETSVQQGRSCLSRVPLPAWTCGTSRKREADGGVRGQRLARAGRGLVRHRSMWDACVVIAGNSLTVPFAEAGAASTVDFGGGFTPGIGT